MVFWHCCDLVYAEFGPDARKEKQNVIQDTYFNILMHFRHAIWCRGQGLLSQKIVLIQDNSYPRRVQLIKILLKGFHWEQFE